MTVIWPENPGPPSGRRLKLTLTEFLLARIAEDEAAAKAAQGAPRYPHYGDTPAEETLEMALGEGCAEEGAAHFDRHMPARVLAECEAKRRIVNEHRSADLDEDGRVIEFGSSGEGWCFGCGANFIEEYRCRVEECPTLRALALPDADHSDYRKEWKP